MRALIGGLIAGALWAVVVGEVVAQTRIGTPIIVTRPSAGGPAARGASETRVMLQGPGAAGRTPAGRPSGTGFATAPTASREIRLFIPRSGAAGGARRSAPTPRSFHTSPSRSQEIRVFPGGGGGQTRTPLFILAD